jgi:hypothetical protein
MNAGLSNTNGIQENYQEQGREGREGASCGYH